MRGQTAVIGDTRVSPNGYNYTRTKNGWRLTHHLVAEEMLGRPLESGERVHFKTGDKTNLSPENITVVQKGKTSVRRRLAQIDVRIEELQAEKARLEAEL